MDIDDDHDDSIQGAEHSCISYAAYLMQYKSCDAKSCLRNEILVVVLNFVSLMFAPENHFIFGISKKAVSA